MPVEEEGRFFWDLKSGAGAAVAVERDEEETRKGS